MANLPTASASRRNPKWSRDELILALDLYMKNPSSPPGHSSDEVIQLSDLLNRLGTKLGHARNADFRNSNGVYMKMMNFARLNPEMIDAGKVGLTRGGKDEEEVWKEFASDLKRLRQVADAIRAAVEAPESVEETELDDGIEAEEGKLLTRLHRSRERNRKLVDKLKTRAMKEHGCLRCEACGFDFEEIYGERGRGFIECHHTKPVHTLGDGTRTRLEDLALLCANCHRMVHSARPWLSLDELWALLAIA